MQVEIAGVRGRLIKCEMDSVHTYIYFSSDLTEDVLVDVTYRQFLVITDWMGDSPNSDTYQVSVPPHNMAWTHASVLTTHRHGAWSCGCTHERKCVCGCACAYLCMLSVVYELQMLDYPETSTLIAGFVAVV